MNRNELKTLLRIPFADESQDDYFDVILPMSIEWVQTYCGNRFEDSEGNLALPGGVKMAVAQLVRHSQRDSNVSSKGVSDVSVSFFSSDMSDSIKNMLRKYRKVRFS